MAPLASVVCRAYACTVLALGKAAEGQTALLVGSAHSLPLLGSTGPAAAPVDDGIRELKLGPLVLGGLLLLLLPLELVELAAGACWLRGRLVEVRSGAAVLPPPGSCVGAGGRQAAALSGGALFIHTQVHIRKTQWRWRQDNHK